ncbi:type II and III secretion system protein [Bryocella elongata]|uniref:Type II and III secretion system protein n=1 Tax=Bryocella elongata TaxID=863522 RepID=A0A1H5T4C5_9BACT|nr:type II secretory protein PulD [Bryocella elongata]SEF57619.1 type II and III secretion system protein [Bryocella elongata]
MAGPYPFRDAPPLRWACSALLLSSALLYAQSPSDAPASVPANTGAATAAASPSVPAPISARQARDADDAYLSGAKHVSHGELEAAERDFGRALKLNPNNSDYAQAVAVTRQQRVTALVEQAARSRVAGDNVQAQRLLAEAQKLDPGNPIVTQHLGPQAVTSPAAMQNIDLFSAPADHVGGLLAGPIHLSPTDGLHSFHQRSSQQELLRQVYAAYGIRASFDSSFTSNSSLRLDLDDVNFADATRVMRQLTHSFAVPIDAKTALIAKDTTEDRDRLEPQIEETIFLPGMSGEQMTELANVARNVFEIKKVTSSPASGGLLVTGDEPTLRLLNATYDDMLDGGSDVLLDIRLFETSKSHTKNIGLSTPTGAGAFSIAAEATSLVSANQSLIQQAVASGVLTLNGTAIQNLIKEVAFLVAAGAVSSTQYSNLLGTFGGGLTYAGLYLASGTTFNLLLSSTDTRLLDAVTLRAGNRQPASFRAGSRYPVITGSYSSGASSALASQLAGLNVNGTSVSSLLSQYLGSTSTTVPQFQYEDLGLTLKATPNINHTGGVSLTLDMKLEALGGTSINSIPVLNNRVLTSVVNVPAGQTAMLATVVDRSELRSIAGLPGLSELPGFQGTDKDAELSDDQLLITITPHIVRASALHIASRPLSMPKPSPSAGAEP